MTRTVIDLISITVLLLPNISKKSIQWILRFVNKTRFVNTFFGNENVKNRVCGGFQKAKAKFVSQDDLFFNKIIFN